MPTKERDYSAFDRPEIVRFLFNPRPEWGTAEDPETYQTVTIDVDEAVTLGARFYPAHPLAPNLLFFHGNGEIVADYDDIAQLYRRMNVNFFPVDYRGYGLSSGQPTVSNMMRDSHRVLAFFRNFLADQGYKGPCVVMGRSLGSASALELAASFPDRIDGLIIESGFALALPLLRLIGVDTNRLGVREEEGFDNLDKIRGFVKPTLIIHAEYDHIIPFSDGEALFEACAAKDKTLLMIPSANHNDIFSYGLQEYMDAVKLLLERIMAER